jgi:hypothetical protein
MALPEIGEIWEITNPQHDRCGAKFIITSGPVTYEGHIHGAHTEYHMVIEFRYIDGSPDRGRVSWIRRDCTLRSESNYPTK